MLLKTYLCPKGSAHLLQQEDHLRQIQGYSILAEERCKSAWQSISRILYVFTLDCGIRRNGLHTAVPYSYGGTETLPRSIQAPVLHELSLLIRYRSRLFQRATDKF